MTAIATGVVEVAMGATGGDRSNNGGGRSSNGSNGGGRSSNGSNRSGRSSNGSNRVTTVATEAKKPESKANVTCLNE